MKRPSALAPRTLADLAERLRASAPRYMRRVEHLDPVDHGGARWAHLECGHSRQVDARHAWRPFLRCARCEG